MNFINKMMEQFIKMNRRMKRWQRVVSVLSAIVVFATTYALVLPAITLDVETASTQAGIEIAASENESESGGTVYDAATDEELEEAEQKLENETEDMSVDEDSSSQSGSEDAELSEDEKDEEPAGNPDVTEEEKEEDNETAADALTLEEESEYAATESVDFITEDTQLIYESEDYIIYADFGESAKFPIGVELRVKEITEESDPDVYAIYYEKALSEMQDKYDESTALSFARFYDITFVYDDAEIEPSGNVNVRIEYKKAVDIKESTTVDTIHFDKNDDEKVEVIDSDTEGSQEKVEAVEFESDQFSVYGIVGTETIKTQYLTASGKTYTITVTYEPEAGIPKDAQLYVREIVKGTKAYDDYYQKALESIDMGDDPEFAVARVFDISIIAGGQEVQPEAPVEVSICLDKDEDILSENTANDELAYIVVHVDEFAKVIETTSYSNSEQDEMKFEVSGFSPYMLLGYSNKSKAGKIGVTNTDHVVIRKDHNLINSTIGMIPEKGTMLEILGNASGIADGLFSQWYLIKHEDITGYVQKQYIDILEETEGHVEAAVGNTRFTVEGTLPVGAELVVTESDITKDQFTAYFNPNDQGLIHNIWPFDISIEVDKKSWQPTDPVTVTVSSPDFHVESNELLGVLHVVDALDGVPEYWVELKDNTFHYEATGFSPYVFYTVDSEYVAGERVKGTNWTLLDDSFFDYWEQLPEEAVEEDMDTKQNDED